jgi:hypothetical protein
MQIKSVIAVIAVVVASFGAFATPAFAGVMKAGQWEITSTLISAVGPGVRSTAPTKPVVNKACMSQAFVDRENYTNPMFSLNRLTRGKFECKVDTKTGDVNAAEWVASCTREDDFTATLKGGSVVTATTLAQTAEEHIKRGNETWTLMKIRIDAKFIGEKCGTDTSVIE